MVVSENGGDIVHTYEFERCKNRYGLTVWLCRKADPESKGMVESGVKFVSTTSPGTAISRILISGRKTVSTGLSELAMAKSMKKQKDTGRVFTIEKQHLRPVPTAIYAKADDSMATTPVRKQYHSLQGESL